ncbi:MAG TPA: response regulator [Flavitalea sp.]|nr:response regulator [Flavitalea sp.]
MPSQKLVFILADDDADDWEIFQEGLREIAPPHILHWVKHGDKILPGIKEISPDILFLDLNLPGGYTGMDCLRMIKEDHSLRDMPVVVYTTSSATEQIKECYSLGAARYLLKPVSYFGIFKGLELIFQLYQTDKLVTTGFQEFVIDTYKLK